MVTAHDRFGVAPAEHFAGATSDCFMAGSNVGCASAAGGGADRPTASAGLGAVH